MIMKIKLPLAVFILCFTHFSALSQTNLGFEQWESIDTYEDPKSWNTFNNFTAFGTNVSCSKTNGHWGNHAARLTSVIIPAASDTLPGALYQAVPYTKRPKSLNAYYKYSGKAADSAYILVMFFKGGMDTGNLIGSATLYLSSKSNWTFIQGNIEWESTETPDTMMLFVNTSFTNYFDTVYVDDIGISDFNTGLQSVQHTTPILYQGSSHYLNVLDDGQVMPKHLVLRNLYGAVVFDEDIQSNTIDIGYLPVGLYVYELLTEDGPVTGKLLIGKSD